jgi:dTDP-4-dehydrorhamnose 3,5-epimerase
MTLDELEREGYMFSKGYRPSGRNQHISVVRFAELFLREEEVIILDRMRRKRHATIYDVAVDLRKNSPTFGKYVGVNLSEENKYQLYIPRYCAHGFLVLSDFAEVIYKADNVYAPEYEGGLIWNDPDVNVKWPNDNPILSQKDQKLPTLRELVERGEVYYSNVFI